MMRLVTPLVAILLTGAPLSAQASPDTTGGGRSPSVPTTTVPVPNPPPACGGEGEHTAPCVSGVPARCIDGIDDCPAVGRQPSVCVDGDRDHRCDAAVAQKRRGILGSTGRFLLLGWLRDKEEKQQKQ